MHGATAVDVTVQILQGSWPLPTCSQELKFYLGDYLKARQDHQSRPLKNCRVGPHAFSLQGVLDIANAQPEDFARSVTTGTDSPPVRRSAERSST